MRRAERGDKGSVLVLMPAAVLVLLILAAIAVDAAMAFLGEREMADLAAAAAGDAVGAGFAEDRFYEQGELCLAQDRVQAVAEESARVHAPDADVRDVQVKAERGLSDDGRPQVTVSATGVVEAIFAPAIPGAASARTVDAESVAVSEEQRDGGGVMPVTERC